MSSKTRFQIEASVTGMEGVKKLQNSIKQLKKSTLPTSAEITKLRTAAKELGRQSDLTENDLRTQASVFRELRANVSLTGTAYKKLTADIQRAERALEKAAAAGKRSSFSFGKAAKGLGAVAGAGVFGGVEGAAGASLGLVLSGGNPGAALAGGAVGAQLGMGRRQLGEIGIYQASLKKQRLALELVIADTDKYKKAQEFLAESSEKLAIPQDVIVRQFTALTASVVGAGQSVEDAQEVFLSIASGIRGTGGSLEDMKAAMTATAQVFSKGKVSAEELRQQLGERLPGAFTIFASSMKMKPAELDKALEQGKVTLQDFMGFSKFLFKEYGKNAEILATSPAAAGDRLATEFSKFKDTFGGFFANIGASLQDGTTNILKFFNTNQVIIKKYVTDIVNISVGIGTVFKKVWTDIFGGLGQALVTSFNFIKNQFKKLADFINGFFQGFKKLWNAFAEAMGHLGLGRLFEVPWISISDETGDTLKTNLDKVTKPLNDYKKELKELFDKNSGLSIEEVFGTPKFDEFIKKAIEAKEAANKLNNELDKTGDKINIWQDMKAGAMAFKNSIVDISKQIQDATKNAFDRMADSLTEFVMTGKMNFKEFARSVIADITKIYVKSQILGMFDFLGNKFGGGKTPVGTQVGNDLGDHLGSLKLIKNAKGNVYAQNGIVPFAKGGIVDGIVNKPTIFPFANGGVGLMGEAGYPEAIIPLKRGRDGKLGVSGGGGTSVVVNVDASGSEVEGSEGDAAALGRAISAAVTQELINQKRPGGLLSAA